jgi:hypothetical protein
MTFDIQHAARRAEIAARVVHGHAMAGHCDFRDVETLCAAVMQLSQCCRFLASALEESGAQTRFESTEVILGRGLISSEHARAIHLQFRDVIENSATEAGV